MDVIDLTVAVCTWNRAALLDQTLGGMAALRVPAGLRWELLVVDNASPDHTAGVLAAHAVSGRLPLRRLHEPQQGLSHARNRALDEARGRWVLWTDDDVLPAESWLAEIAGTVARHPTAAAVGGPVEPWFPVAPDPDLLAAFPPLAVGFCGVDHGPAERPLAGTEHLFGANMGFNRAVTAGLRFDPTMGRRGAHQGGNDDVDFLRRARRLGPVIYSPNARLRHYVAPDRMTLGYAKRFVQDGYCRKNVARCTAPHYLGVPRWMLRMYLAALAREWAPQPRADRLRHRIERWRTVAMMNSYRKAAAAGFPTDPETTETTALNLSPEGVT
jgi:glycosyltransferase involved in cell wall biosynthesis